MNRTLLRLLLAVLTLAIFLGAAACDGEDSPDPGNQLPGPKPEFIGNNPVVIDACKLACEAKRNATVCTSDANLAGQVDGCVASCAGQVANVPKACTDIAIRDDAPDHAVGVLHDDPERDAQCREMIGQHVLRPAVDAPGASEYGAHAGHGAGVEWSRPGGPGAGLAPDRSGPGTHDNRDGPISAKSISRASPLCR